MRIRITQRQKELISFLKKHSKPLVYHDCIIQWSIRDVKKYCYNHPKKGCPKNCPSLFRTIKKKDSFSTTIIRNAYQKKILKISKDLNPKSKYISSCELMLNKPDNPYGYKFDF